MSMNPFLARMYGTPGAPTDEDLEKVAAAQLFAKLAKDNNINLDDLTNDQIAGLWDEVMPKEAGELPPALAAAAAAKKGEGKEEEKKEEKKDEKEEEKESQAKEAAVQEFMQKKAHVDQMAYMDYCGRVMAHSYVDELTKIGQSMQEGGEKPEPETEAEHAERISKLAEAAPGVQAEASQTTTQNLDYFAAQHAVELAKKANVAEDEVVSRLNALLTLGPKDSEKIASAQNVDQALDIRALELLEQAGYEINWG
jgi:hypothetical protein